jgi:hypothetical protein
VGRRADRTIVAIGGYSKMNKRDKVLADHFNLFHGVDLNQIERTEVPGYWRDKTLCAGKRGGCNHPIHRLIFCEGPTHHTYSYRDKCRNELGQFVSPYQTWRSFGKEVDG